MIKKIFKGLGLAVLFCGLLFIATALNIWQYAEKDEVREADTAVILGAGSFNGEISQVFAERISHGVWLYEQGYVKCLLMTGGYGTGSSVAESQAAKDYAVSLGVPEEDILTEESSRTTYGNLYYAEKVMEEEGLESALIVSDPLHMYRSVMMAEDLGMEVYTSPTPTSRYITMKTRLPFLMRETVMTLACRISGLLGIKAWMMIKII